MITMIKLSKWFSSRDSEMFKMLKSLFHVIIWLCHRNSYLMPSDNSPKPKLKYISEKLLPTMGENCKMKQNLYLISAEKLQKLNKTWITK